MLRDLIAMVGLCFFLALSVLAFFFPIHMAYFYSFVACIAAISCYIAYSREKKPISFDYTREKKLPKNDDQIGISRSVGEDMARKTALSTYRERAREKREMRKRERKKGKREERKKEDNLFQQAEKILNE